MTKVVQKCVAERGQKYNKHKHAIKIMPQNTNVLRQTAFLENIWKIFFSGQEIARYLTTKMSYFSNFGVNLRSFL